MATRKRRRKQKAPGGLLLIVGLGLLLSVAAVRQTARIHPAAVTLTGVVVAGAASAWLLVRWRSARRVAEQERSIAVTDSMTGTQFEHYVARLLRASGCRRVKVCGGAGDLGADVVGYAPDGRRLVVQCKRYKGKLGSPDVQRFAGTVRDVHRADVALLVTTGFATQPAIAVARRCRITLVARPALARWAATQILPIPGWEPPEAQAVREPVAPAGTMQHRGTPTGVVHRRPSATGGSDWWTTHHAP